MNKVELAEANEKTREVKQREENVKEGVKEAAHEVKQGVKDIANKTENMDLKDAPDRLLPSADKIDRTLQSAEEKLEEARHAKLGEKDLTRYPKIQQVMKDEQRILEDTRNLIKEKNEDGTLSDTARHTAQLADLIKNETLGSLDALWSNWAALLTVVAGASAGSWKQILQESGHLLNQVRHTEDFMRLLNDLQEAFGALSSRATKFTPVGEELKELNAVWDTQRDKLMEDWKRIWALLNESPIWRQLVTKGKALGNKVADVAGETKEEASKKADKVADSKEVLKLKEDLKNVLQLIVGKDGPNVQPFLDYSQAAYDDIIENEDFSKLASEMSELFENPNKQQGQSQAQYEEQYNKMYDDTKKLLDNTVNNRNIRLAMRESRKLIKAAKQDPAIKKLLADVSKITKDAGGKHGSILDPQLLNEIRAVIVPLLVEHFDNAPLPNYHGADSNALGKFDYTLSEIRMGTTGLVPSKVKVEFRYKAEANPSQLKMERQQMFMYLEASDMQVSFKDVKWEYNRHTIPRFSDNGTVDLCTAGKGITLKLKAELKDYAAPQHAGSLSELLTEEKEKRMFNVLRAECLIDDFHVRISDAGGANVFYEMLAGIWGTKIKHQIENLVEEKMNILASKFDHQLYDIVKRATQPSLAEEAKDTLLGAGKVAGAKVEELAESAKKNLQSM